LRARGTKEISRDINFIGHPAWHQVDNTFDLPNFAIGLSKRGESNTKLKTIANNQIAIGF
jgi:hypothetical protein